MNTQHRIGHWDPQTNFQNELICSSGQSGHFTSRVVFFIFSWAKFFKKWLGNEIHDKLGANFLGGFDTFFIQFKNTSNLIYLGFKVPSDSLFPKNFKIGLTF